MKSSEFIQRLWRRAELELPNPRTGLQRLIYRLRGAKIGKDTHLPLCRMVWPHQVRIGDRCVLQHNIFFNYDHYWTPGPSIIIGDRVFIGEGTEFNCQGRIEIGDDCLIAVGCRFVDHDHGMEAGTSIRAQKNVIEPIRLGKNVWLGANVIVLRGVTIGDNAVIGAGAVVTKSVPAGEKRAGVPARTIGHSKDV